MDWRSKKSRIMHEMTVAQNIIDSIMLEAQSKKASHVKEIDIDIGELMQLDTKVLKEGMRLLLPSIPLLKGAHVRFYRKKTSFRCRKCGSFLGVEDARRQLSKVSQDLLVRETDSKELPLHFLPYLYPTFVHCPKCSSSDMQISEGGEDISLRKLVME